MEHSSLGGHGEYAHDKIDTLLRTTFPAAQTTAAADAAAAAADAAAAQTTADAAAEAAAAADAAAAAALAATATLSAAVDAADAAATHVFNAQPLTPYDLGNTWHDGGTVHICIAARATGAFVAGDWTNFSLFAQYIAANVAMSAPVITGGIVTGGLFRTATSGLRVELSGGEFVDRVRFFDGTDTEAAVLQYTDVTPKGLGIHGVHPNFQVDGDLNVSGNLTAASTSSGPWVSLASSFVNSWVAHPNGWPPACNRQGDIETLCGYVKSGVSTARAFTLPVGYKPAHPVIRDVLCANNVIARLDINPDGGCFITIPAAGSNVWVSLDGTSFRVA